MYRSLKLILVMAVSMLVLGGTASAAVPTVVDQYTEQVPTAGGDKPAADVPAVTDQDNSGGSPGATTGGTGGAGGSGTGQTGGQGGSGSTGGSTAENAQVDGGQSGSSLPGAVLSGLDSGSGSSGMGWLFPASLIAVAVAMVALAISRRRSGGPEAPE